MGVEQKLGNMGVATTTLEQAVAWSRTNAMWPMLFGLACCAIEMMSAQAAHYDMSRFGMELMRPSPRQSDLMIVAGRVSRKMAPVLRRLYDQMPEPKWVISMGDCASCGGVFNNYAIVQGVDEVVPVDVYVAGCPPRPEALIHGVLTLYEKVRGMKFAEDQEIEAAHGQETATHRRKVGKRVRGHRLRVPRGRQPGHPGGKDRRGLPAGPGSGLRTALRHDRRGLLAARRIPVSTSSTSSPRSPRTWF